MEAEALNIIDYPDFASDYEFVVVTKDENGMLHYDSCYADGFLAEQRCLNIGGIIVHNVRIQGVRRK